MSKSKTRIKILNPISGCGHTSVKHAHTYVRRGVAEWVGDAIRFLRVAAPVVVRDSGQAGFARYPMPLAVSVGPRFPGLARQGAGL